MTKANGVLGAAALIFGLGCFLLFRALGIERERVQALEVQLTQLQRDLKTSAPTPAPHGVTSASESHAQSVAATAHEPSSSPSSTSVPSKPSADQRQSERDAWRQVSADPAYRAAMRAQHRLDIEKRLPGLGSELALSQDEANRFLDLLAGQSLRDAEQSTKEYVAGNSEDGREQARKMKERYDQAERERRAFLGEEKYRAWTEYVESAGARALVGDLRTQLATSSSPLREDQVKPLVKVLAAEQQRHSLERQQNRSGAEWTYETPAAERIAYMERRAQLIEESLQRSQQAGAMYLDSEQQRYFDEMLDRQRQTARAEFELWRASLEAEKRAQTAGSR